MSEQMPLAEVEIKIRLSAEEFARMPAVLPALAFSFSAESALTDYYLHYARGARGGYDFTRLRARGGTFLLTRKQWTTDAQGHPVRLEEEHAVSAAEAKRLLAAAPGALLLRKHRWDYRGCIDRHAATISLDALELRGETRYFLECEVIIAPAEAAAARERLRAWMRDHLPAGDQTEAPSMLELLLDVTGETG